MNRDGVLKQTLQRYFTSVEDEFGLWVLATAVLLAIAVPIALRRKHTLPTWLLYVSLVPVVGLALAYGWKLRWIGDDAFISFRYARNFAEGLGLVYNTGARVEGYTNFLWTVLIAGFIAVGLDPGQVSIVLSLSSLAASCVFAALLKRRLLAGRHSLLVSLAALLLASNYTFASFGTSGLETMFASLLVLVAVDRAQSGALLASGAAAIGATMAHPDHSIFYVVLGLLLFARERLPATLGEATTQPSVPRWRALLVWIGQGLWNLRWYAAPLVLVYLPYFVWRTAYYGDLFPNTYYTKSGGEAYFEQGFRYLWISAIGGGVWPILPFSLVGIIAYRRTLTGQFTLLAGIVYLFYVAKVGGDFMLGRLLCPMLPLLFVMAELGLRRLLAADRVSRRVLGLAAVPLLALVAVPALVIKGEEKYFYVADEGNFYRLRSFSPVAIEARYTEMAAELEQAFATAVRPPVVGLDCVGIVGYETGLPTFDYWGLTDPRVARIKITKRGRPGHEKHGSLGHAVEANADFADVETFLEPYRKHTFLKIGTNRFYLLKYDAALLKPLRDAKAVHVEDFEQWVKRWKPPELKSELACDAWFMSQFYFTQNPRDRGERIGRRTLATLAKRLPAGMVNWVMFGDSPERAGYRELRRYSFEPPLAPVWQATGSAFEDAPSVEAAPGQAHIVGHEGAFVNSYSPTSGDELVGELSSAEFTLQGDAVTLKIGGGLDSKRLTVALVVEGEIVASQTGCASTVMYRWAWNTSAYHGRRARFRIVDHGTAGWGHVIVDEIVEWQRLSTASVSNE